MPNNPPQIARDTALSYRELQSSDIPGILRLWAENSGWGSITEQQFYDWYMHTPYGPCLTVVAVNDQEEVVGQQVYMPREATINGHTCRVLRAVAPILAAEARVTHMLSPKHPLTDLFRCAAQLATGRDYAMIYTLPAYGWSAWMKAFYRFGLPAWDLAIYPCFRIDLKAVHPAGLPLAGKWLVEQVPHLPNLTLQQPAASAQSNTFVRNPAWINWKFAEDHLYCLWDGTALAGYVVLKKDSRLILDLWAAEGYTIPVVFYSFLRALITGQVLGAQILPDTISGMLNPLAERLLKDIPYTLVDYKFVYGMYRLTEHIDTQLFRPDEWDLFPGD